MSKTTHDTTIKRAREDVMLNILDRNTNSGRKMIKVGCNTCSYTDWILSDHKSKYQNRARDYHDSSRDTGKQPASMLLQAEQSVPDAIASWNPLVPASQGTTLYSSSPSIRTESDDGSQVTLLKHANGSPNSTALVPLGGNHVASPASLVTDALTAPPGSERLPIVELKKWSTPQGKAKELYAINGEEGTVVYAILGDTGKHVQLGRLIPQNGSFPHVLPKGKMASVTLQEGVQSVVAKEEKQKKRAEEKLQKALDAIESLMTERQQSPGLRLLATSPDPKLWTRENFAKAIGLPSVRTSRELSLYQEHKSWANMVDTDKDRMPKLVGIEMACNSQLIDYQDDSQNAYEQLRKRHHSVDHLLGVFLHPRTNEKMRIWVYIGDFEDDCGGNLIDIYETVVQRAINALKVGTLQVAASPSAYLKPMNDCSQGPPTHLVKWEPSALTATTHLEEALRDFGSKILHTTNAHATKDGIGIGAFNAAVECSVGTMLSTTNMQPLSLGDLRPKFKTFCVNNGYESTESKEAFMTMDHNQFEDALGKLYDGIVITYDYTRRTKVVHGVVHVNQEAEPRAVCMPSSSPRLLDSE